MQLFGKYTQIVFQVNNSCLLKATIPKLLLYPWKQFKQVHGSPAHLKSVHLFWDVDCSEVHKLAVLGIVVVSQERQHRDDPIGMDQELKLIARGRERRS